MEEDDILNIQIDQAHIERLSRLFGSKREPRPFVVSEMNLLVMPSAAPVVDAAHPDRLDWRSVRLAIDLDEGRYQHLIVDPQPGGREHAALFRCRVFETLLGHLVTSLYNRVWPDRETGDLTFPDNIRMLWNYTEPDTGAPVFSFHGNARSQKRLMEMSNHERLALTQAWHELVAQERARQAASGGVAP